MKSNRWGARPTCSEIETMLTLHVEAAKKAGEFDLWRGLGVERKPNLVYFIRGGRTLKIGTTDKIQQRFANIQAQSPIKLKLLGLIYGGENVERWMQFQCINHRTHYEWFSWNKWTESFVNFVLAHGDDAAKQLCPEQADLDLTAMVPGKPRAQKRNVPTLPQMRLRNADDRKNYREEAASRSRRVTPLGSCSCDTCRTKPWESWSAA